MGSEGLQERYINPCTDFGFKKLFGTELNKEYEDSLKVYRDWYSTMKTQYRKGHIEGQAVGRAEGRAEEKITIAHQMKVDGVSVEVISRYTGLSIEEVQQL